MEDELEEAVGACDADVRLLPEALDVVAVFAEVVDVLCADVLCADVLVAAVVVCCALESCAATAVTTPVRPIAPAIIRFVAEEASFSPASRRLRGRFFIVSESLTAQRKSALKGPSDEPKCVMRKHPSTAA